MQAKVSGHQTALRGELRRLPPSLGWRLLQAFSLWFLFVGIGRLVIRYAGGYRHTFSLEEGAQRLVLKRHHKMLGVALSCSETILPLENLEELTLERTGEAPSFVAGLGALMIGSFLGVRLFIEGVSARGGAVSLLILGPLLVLAGLALDFFVGSGRSYRSWRGPAQLIVRVRGDRGWVLSHLDPEQARLLMSQVDSTLAEASRSQQPLS